MLRGAVLVARYVKWSAGVVALVPPGVVTVTSTVARGPRRRGGGDRGRGPDRELGRVVCPEVHPGGPAEDGRGMMTEVPRGRAVVGPNAGHRGKNSTLGPIM